MGMGRDGSVYTYRFAEMRSALDTVTFRGIITTNTVGFYPKLQDSSCKFPNKCNLHTLFSMMLQMPKEQGSSSAQCKARQGKADETTIDRIPRYLERKANSREGAPELPLQSVAGRWLSAEIWGRGNEMIPSVRSVLGYCCTYSVVELWAARARRWARFWAT